MFGASVEKISDAMDGIFRQIDFTQEPVSVVDDILNLHIYQLLVRYKDPVQGTRSLILMFTQKRWCVADQGNSLSFMSASPLETVANTILPYGTSGSDVTGLWTNPTENRNVEIQTALSFDNNPFINKRIIRIGIAQSVTTSGGQVNVTLDSENGSSPFSETIGSVYTWFNANQQSFQWKNTNSANFNFTSSGGFGYIYNGENNQSGIYIGATLSGMFNGYNLHAITLEYQTGAMFASRNT